jgi:hypothetical protein
VRWRVPLTTVLVMLASLAGAQVPHRLPLADQARVLRENMALLQVTVAGSLELADQDNALDRVDSCHRLIKFWAREIEAAVRQGNPSRASEMSTYLNKIADGGVASNLRAARKLIPPSTPDERLLLQRRDAALHDLEVLENVLAEFSRNQRELRPVVGRLQAVRRIVAEAADLPKP